MSKIKKMTIEENLMVDLTIEGSKRQIVDILTTLGISNERVECKFSMDNDLSNYDIDFMDFTKNNILYSLFQETGESEIIDCVDYKLTGRGVSDFLYNLSICYTPSKTYKLTFEFSIVLLNWGNLNQWVSVVKRFPKSKWTIKLYGYDKDTNKTVDVMERTIHHKVLKSGESKIVVK